MSQIKIPNMAVDVATIFIIIFINHVLVISAGNGAVIPAKKSLINSWFSANVKPYTVRKTTLDPALSTAQAGERVIKVGKDGSGKFKTINDAIKSIPHGNKKRVILSIGAGEYVEKIKIDRSKPFIMFYGSPRAMPKLTFAGTAKQYGTVDSATLIVESDYFMAVNIILSNSSPRPDGKRVGAQAAALRISGNKAAFYNCKITGFQDTLCDDRGYHFFKDCHLEGTVDFIFGSGKSLYLNTELRAVGDTGLTVIAAQARESAAEDNGFAFVHCRIVGSGNETYLGRAWKASPRVVYAYTIMGPVVHRAGWTDNFHPERQGSVYYGEYKCSGPGASPAGRVKYAKQLSDAEARQFLVLDYIKGPRWILPPPAEVYAI